MKDFKVAPIHDEEFRLLRDLIYEFSGIYFKEELKYIFEKRLASRLEYHQLCNFHDYYHFVKYDSSGVEEKAEIIDLLTTTETYFFREKYQLRAFSEEIIPELTQRKAAVKRLRIWSAGCSTGEEPYTVAMILLEVPELREWVVEIFANDINNRVLQQARRGVYRSLSFRDTEPKYIEKYFVKKGDLYHIKEEVRRMVTFGNINLLDSKRLMLLGNIDVIFCRNVIIYFGDEAKGRVIDTFYDRLEPGGYLLLGHAESLINVTTKFELVHLKNDMVYRKPVGGRRDI